MGKCEKENSHRRDSFFQGRKSSLGAKRKYESGCGGKRGGGKKGAVLSRFPSLHGLRGEKDGKTFVVGSTSLQKNKDFIVSHCTKKVTQKIDTILCNVIGKTRLFFYLWESFREISAWWG